MAGGSKIVGSGTHPDQQPSSSGWIPRRWADLTPTCRAAVSQTLRQVLLQESNCIYRDPLPKRTVIKRGLLVIAGVCHQDPVTTGRDRLHAGAKERATRQRTLGHTAFFSTSTDAVWAWCPGHR